jgi:integrase
MLFSEVAAKWLEAMTIGGNKPSTIEFYGFVVNRLNKVFAKTQFRNLDQATLKTWKKKRLNKAARTRNKEMIILRQIINYAQETLHIAPASPLRIKLEPGPKKKLRTPTAAQVVAILKEMRRETKTESAADFIEFLSLTGSRKSEAAEVKWGDVDFKKKSGLDANRQTTRNRHGTGREETQTAPAVPIPQDIPDSLAVTTKRRW